jgi:hypothetical protein
VLLFFVWGGGRFGGQAPAADHANKAKHYLFDVNQTNGTLDIL